MTSCCSWDLLTWHLILIKENKHNQICAYCLTFESKTNSHHQDLITIHVSVGHVACSQGNAWLTQTCPTHHEWWSRKILKNKTHTQRKNISGYGRIFFQWWTASYLHLKLRWISRAPYPFTSCCRCLCMKDLEDYNPFINLLPLFALTSRIPT